MSLNRLNFYSLWKKVLIVLNIVAFSFMLSVILNSYIALKSFYLSENVNVKRVNKKVSYNNYQNIAYLFKDIKTTKSNETTNYEENYEIIPDIKLIGTVIFKGKKLALLKKSKRTYMIKEGEIFDGYKVISIDKFSVKLGKNGRVFVIKPDIFSHKLTGKNLKINTNDTGIDTQTIVLSRNLVEKETADIGNLLKDVRLVPIVKNGETLGYKFTYVSPKSLLYKYGLRSGDFIKSINGMPVRTAEDAFKIYNMLRNESRIELEIDRFGKRKVIVYEIR